MFFPLRLRNKLDSSLTYKTLLSMGIRISIVITTAAFISYLHIVDNLEQQTYDKLEKYITERTSKESTIFELAEDNHAIFRKAFLERWPNRQKSPAQMRFEALFEPYQAQTYRLKQDYFTGHQRSPASSNEDMGTSRWISGFIGQNAAVTDPLFLNKTILAYDLVDRFGEGWSNRFANTYVSLPEGVNIVYWPELNWAKNVQADLDIPAEEWVYIANKENNPERKSVWTGLYYDQTADEWMVSCETPIDDQDGNHLANIGHDILLNSLFQRVFNDHLSGAYNFIFRKDGRLIAHPYYTDQLEQARGLLDINQIKTGDINQIYQTIGAGLNSSSHAHQPMILGTSSDSDALYAVAPIKGPDWYFVTVYPKYLLSTPASEAAKFIFLLGVISLIIELVMLYLVLRKKVIQPLAIFETASNEVSQGNYNLTPVFEQANLNQQNDEIGMLRVAFKNMAARIHDYSVNIEEKVKQRTQEAEQAKELAERQARTDALTSLPNRRAFYEYGEYAFQHAKRHKHDLTAIMLDIDYFKQINDTYGHATGDDVLQSMAAILKQGLRPSDLIARHGGEEFVILLSNTNINGANTVATKLRQQMIEQTVSASGQKIHYSASFGIAKLRLEHENLDDLLKDADQAMYQAKNNGRDRIEIA